MGVSPVMGVSPESRSVLGKALLFLRLAAFLSCARSPAMAGVTHLQHCRMLLGSHQLLLMQVAFGDSF